MTYPGYQAAPLPPEDQAAVTIAWGLLGLAAVLGATMLSCLVTLLDR